MANTHLSSASQSDAPRAISQEEHLVAHYRLSHSVLNQIYQKAGDAILVFDPHTEQVFEVNDTACAIYGYTHAEFRSLSIKHLTKDVERGTKAINCLLNGEDIGNFETIQYRKSGEEIVLLCKASLIEYEGKTAVLSLNRDITEMRQKEREMRDKRMMLDLIIKASQVGFYRLDLETHQIYFSPSYKAQLSYTDEEFPNLYESWKSRLHPDDAEHAIATVNALIRGDIDQFELFHRLRDKNGGYRRIICNSTLLKDDSGKPVKIIGVHTDITSLWNKELALQDSEEKFRHVFRRVPVSISILDAQTRRFIDVNDQFESIFEIPRNEAIGKTSEELGLLLSPEHNALITACLSKGVPTENLEHRFVTRSGKERFLIYSVEAIQLTGQPCIVVVANDVTEQCLAQQKQERLTEQLFQSQKLEAIGRLSIGIAHDFNNVLGIIKMASGILRHKLSNPDFLRYLTSIEEAAERGVNISRQLLTFSRQEPQKKEVVSVQHVIDQVIAMLHHSIPKTVDVEVQCLTNNDIIEGDSTQIYQAMLNLAINASDAMPNGGKLCYELSQVSTKFLESKFGKKFEKPFLLVKVKDSGIGMPPEVQRRIFEPFFTTKPKGKGTGLGLSIIHGVVKSHNGFIEVESQEDNGTTFLLYFPLLHAVEAPEPKPRTQRHILLVEDEPDMRALLSDILTEKNFQVTAVENGSEGLAKFHQSPFDIDLVLSDLNIPHLLGIEMLREMKRISPDLKFAVLTGFVTAEDHQDLEALGALRILRKPIQIEDLFSLLDEAL